MHHIIKIVGGLTALIGIAVFVFGALLAFASPGSAIASFPVLAGSFGMMVSGAMLYCFGAIVGHLIAIRRASEHQAEILDRLGKPRV